jgi:hypothetical protein
MGISTNRIHKKFELRELTKMNNGLSIMRCQRNIVEIMNLWYTSSLHKQSPHLTIVLNNEVTKYCRVYDP